MPQRTTISSVARGYSLTIAAIAAFILPSLSAAQVHRPVSMVSLVSSPVPYLGQVISVTGYHHGDLIPSLVYLSREHALVYDAPSAVMVDKTVDGRNFRDLTNCLNQYVTVLGVFSELPSGGYGITNVYRAVALGQGVKPSSSKVCYSAPQPPR